MIYKSHSTHGYPVQLCCINGDRIGLSSSILLGFALSGRAIGVALVLGCALALASSTIYGETADLMIRVLFWPLQLMSSWGMAYLLVRGTERLSRKTGTNYVIVTLGVHLLTLAITLPLGHWITHNHVPFHEVLHAFKPTVVLGYLTAALLFEATLVAIARQSIMVDYSEHVESDAPDVPRFRNSGAKCILRMIGLRRKPVGMHGKAQRQQ